MACGRGLGSLALLHLLCRAGVVGTRGKLGASTRGPPLSRGPASRGRAAWRVGRKGIRVSSRGPGARACPPRTSTWPPLPLVPWGSRRRSSLMDSWCLWQGRVSGSKRRRGLGRFSPEGLQRLSGIWAPLADEWKEEEKRSRRGKPRWCTVCSWEGESSASEPQSTSN